MCPNYPEIKLEPALGEYKKTKLNICYHMLTSSTQLQNRSFHVVERTRTSSKCQKMKNARAKRAKILFFIDKYANLWGFSCRRRPGCLTYLLSFSRETFSSLTKIKKTDIDFIYFILFYLHSFQRQYRLKLTEFVFLFCHCHSQDLHLSQKKHRFCPLFCLI